MAQRRVKPKRDLIVAPLRPDGIVYACKVREDGTIENPPTLYNGDVVTFTTTIVVGG